MTPEQATRAAVVLELHAPPDDPDGCIACLIAADHLRDLAIPECHWWVDLKCLFVGEGDRVLNLGKPSSLAGVVGGILAMPYRTLRLGAKNRNLAKRQRYDLAEKLSAKGLYTLEQAVRDIRLQTIGSAVMATYSPEGLPVRIAQK